VTLRQFDSAGAIVTGGGRGIGRKISLRLASEGCEVFMLGRSLEPMVAVTREIEAAAGRAWCQQADVSLATDVDVAVGRAVDRWGHVDVLVNNAAIDDPTPFLEIDEADWDRVLAVDLKGPFLISQRVARSMVSAGSACAIVNVASIDAFGYNGPYTSYAAAKAGLLALTRSMAIELARHSIGVNAVSPGWTSTEMMEAVIGDATTKRLTSRFERVPIGRAVRPEEVASAVVFLASVEAAAITGTNLVVDGGTSANH
jgi:meso-butanediol dehydrogenase / (S,S)-butanediol dehydrogenase / diacetyl reductase